MQLSIVLPTLKESTGIVATPASLQGLRGRLRFDDRRGIPAEVLAARYRAPHRAAAPLPSQAAR